MPPPEDATNRAAAAGQRPPPRRQRGHGRGTSQQCPHQPGHAPGGEGQQRAQPEALHHPVGQTEGVTQREEGTHRPQVAGLLTALDIPQRSAGGPHRGHVGQEPARVDVEIDLGVSGRQPRPLGERERKRPGAEGQGDTRFPKPPAHDGTSLGSLPATRRTPRVPLAGRDRARPRRLCARVARIWLTIPTYNEAGNLGRVMDAVLDQLRRCAPDDHRVLIVDDASPDGTGELADALARERPALEVLHRPAKQGLGAAYLAGFARALEAGGEMVVVMDADLSHDPAYLPAMLAAAENADLVLGSRYAPGGRIIDWPPLRRLP